MNRFASLIVRVLAVATALAGCCDNSKSMPPNIRKYAFVVTQPPKSAIVGSYVLIDQTVLKSGLSAMQGRQCHLDLRIDGTFTVTNYPNWSEVSGDPDKFTSFTSFISPSGHWRINTVGLTYNHGSQAESCWGIDFYDSQIDPIAFTGQTEPYELISILGDPDSDMVLRFIKRKDNPAL